MIILANDAKPVLLGKKLPYLRMLKLRLFTNSFDITGDTTADDFEEATFSGYAPQDLSDLGNPFLNRNNQGESDTCTHEWRVNGIGLPQSVQGYYCTDAFGWLIFSDRNPAGPVQMTLVGATYTLRINFLEDTLRM